MKREFEREQRLELPPIRRKGWGLGRLRSLLPSLFLAVALASGSLGSFIIAATIAAEPAIAGSDLAPGALSASQLENGQLENGHMENGASAECCWSKGPCHPGATAVLSFALQALHPREWPFSSAGPEQPGIVGSHFRPPRLHAHA